MHTGLNGLGFFQIIALELDQICHYLVLCVVGTLYLDGESWNESGHSHLLSASLQYSLYLAYLGAVVQKDNDLT